MGDRELALSRLEQAIDAGWCDIYATMADPRWAGLLDDPGYQALMTRVRENVDRQCAEVDRMDAAEDFPAVLDTIRESRNATARESADGTMPRRRSQRPCATR